jgi:hypothetical protein
LILEKWHVCSLVVKVVELLACNLDLGVELGGAGNESGECLVRFLGLLEQH